jgi:hypothetical protein
VVAGVRGAASTQMVCNGHQHLQFNYALQMLDVTIKPRLHATLSNMPETTAPLWASQHSKGWRLGCGVQSVHNWTTTYAIQACPLVVDCHCQAPFARNGAPYMSCMGVHPYKRLLQTPLWVSQLDSSVRGAIWGEGSQYAGDNLVCNSVMLSDESCPCQA